MFSFGEYVFFYWKFLVNTYSSLRKYNNILSILKIYIICLSNENIQTYTLLYYKSISNEKHIHTQSMVVYKTNCNL